MWWRILSGSDSRVKSLSKIELKHKILLSSRSILNYERILEDLKAEEQRMIELRHLETELDALRKENRLMKDQIRSLRRKADNKYYISFLDQVTPSTSLLVGPFNNLKIRKLHSALLELAQRCEDPREKERLLFIRDLMSGDSQILAERMDSSNILYSQMCLDMESELNDTITAAKECLSMFDGKVSTDSVYEDEVRLRNTVRELEYKHELMDKEIHDLIQDLETVDKDNENMRQSLENLETEIECAQKGLPPQYLLSAASQALSSDVSSSFLDDCMACTSPHNLKQQCETKRKHLELMKTRKRSLKRLVGTLKEQSKTLSEMRKNLKCN